MNVLYIFVMQLCRSYCKLGCLWVELHDSMRLQYCTVGWQFDVFIISVMSAPTAKFRVHIVLSVY